MSNSPSHRPPVTDSPWFWVGLFCMAGLVVLIVAQGQVTQRQARIERQNQGRQRAVEMATTGEATTEMSTPNNTVITIEPLLVLLVIGVIVSGGMFWRWRSQHGRSGTSDHTASLSQGHASQTSDSSS